MKFMSFDEYKKHYARERAVGGKVAESTGRRRGSFLGIESRSNLKSMIVEVNGKKLKSVDSR